MNCLKSFCCFKKCVNRRAEEIKCIIGATGPAGPMGATGRGLQIDGIVASEELLPKTPLNGTAFLVGESAPRKMFVFDSASGEWIDQGYLQGEKGEKGDKGDTGYGEIKSAYLFTLRSPDFVIYNGGFEVPSRGRLPILEEREVSLESPITLDKENSTILFKEAGVYEIGFTFSAYTKISQDEFDLNADFVAVGFREVDSDNVIAGVNDWGYNEVPHNISGQGIVKIDDVSKEYELVNLHVRPLFLLAGRKEQTMTSSYMITPLVTVVIKQLQKI